jgi:hypothetical protein
MRRTKQEEMEKGNLIHICDEKCDEPNVVFIPRTPSTDTLKLKPIL